MKLSIYLNRRVLVMENSNQPANQRNLVSLCCLLRYIFDVVTHMISCILLYSTKSIKIIRWPMNENICMEECMCLEAMKNLINWLLFCQILWSSFHCMHFKGCQRSKCIYNENPRIFFFVSNKYSDTLSFTKIIYALTEVLKNLHTRCERNIHAYYKNT